MGDFIKIEDFTRKAWAPGDPLPSRINYACGLNPIGGWLNTDYFDGSLLWHFRETGIPVDFANSVVNLDLLDRHPFPSESFDFAFCEDFIEHIDQKSSLRFLSEVWRTLRPGGIFRISTPSYDGVLRRHFWSATREHVEQGISEAYDPWGHVHFYSHLSLEQAATALRFVNYRRCSFGQSSHPELSDRETRTEQIGLNLYAEMQKPGDSR
jgi:SAM-dependent methyltransferase